MVPTLSTGTTDCTYRYTQQPPTSLQCNPYSTGLLILECEVSRDREAQTIEILWVFINGTEQINAPEPIILNDIDMEEKYTIDQTFDISIDRSKLTVNMLDDLDSGQYFCMARFPNDSVTSPSQKLRLFTSEVFRASRPVPCSQSDGQTEVLEMCTLIEIPTLPPTPLISTSTTVRSTSGEDRHRASSIFIGGMTLLCILNSPYS